MHDYEIKIDIKKYIYDFVYILEIRNTWMKIISIREKYCVQKKKQKKKCRQIKKIK